MSVRLFDYKQNGFCSMWNTPVLNPFVGKKMRKKASGVLPQTFEDLGQ